MLHRSGLTVVLLNHHDTAKWIMEKYPEWAFVSKDLKDRVTCATEIYYEYLVEKGLLYSIDTNYAVLIDLVEQTRQYDTWAWEAEDNQFAKDLNTLFNSYPPSDFLENQLNKILDTDNEAGILYFDQMEKFIVDLENKKEAEYIKSRGTRIAERFWNVEGKTYLIGIVVGDNYHSTLGNVLHRQNPHFDFLVILDMNKGKGSLRTIHDHVHVGKIAKAMSGGGGHQKAAGFQFDQNDSIGTLEDSLTVRLNESDIDRLLNELRGLAEAEQNRELTELERQAYVRLAGYCVTNDTEIPFGIVI